ncbi:MAG: isoprenylcysteine carboxylmethyltransferase family protein [Candidatus Paceibacterota bacterium]
MNNFLLLINGIVGLCIFSVVAAVAVDFLFFQERNDQKKEKKSPVATLTMFLFFFLFYAIERNGWGVLFVENNTVRIVMIVIGLVLMIIGAMVNIAGRSKLGGNWSDNIKIYLGHSLVDTGVYAWVRHPLYASLIWMFFGSALVYSNWLAFLANLLIFVPAMCFRAKQEEKLLSQEFKEYEKYKKKAGMFFPKLRI